MNFAIKRLKPFYGFTLCIVILLGHLFSSTDADTRDPLPTCYYLDALPGINLKLFETSEKTYDFKDIYFCSNESPEQYRCRCQIFYACYKEKDPWGRNIGKCKCCSRTGILGILSFMLILLITAVGGIYIIFLRGRWWFDGYSSPIFARFPFRRSSIFVPVGEHLDGIFGNYPGSYFRDFTHEELVNITDGEIAPSIHDQETESALLRE